LKIRFVVLIPHRDIQPQLRAYSERLFAAGIAGAYSFPNVAPLACVSRACSREELKALARAVRELTLSDGADGKLHAGTTQSVSCPATARELTVFGARLTCAPSVLSALPHEAIAFRFPHLVLSAALLGRGDERLVVNVPPPPSVSFRAAMLANMTLTPLGCGDAAYSFAWQVGEPVWLPPARKSCRQAEHPPHIR
jgi:hypothetical protein